MKVPQNSRRQHGICCSAWRSLCCSSEHPCNIIMNLFVVLCTNYLEHSGLYFCEPPLLSQLLQTDAGPKHFLTCLMSTSNFIGPDSLAIFSFSCSSSSSAFSFFSIKKDMKSSLISTTFPVSNLQGQVVTIFCFIFQYLHLQVQPWLEFRCKILNAENYRLISTCCSNRS